MPLATTHQLPLTTISVDGSTWAVTLITTHDGIEYVGRLWFAPVASDGFGLDAVDEAFDPGMPDRGVLPGRSEAEVAVLAQRLTDEELIQRYRRARAEKRRFHGLRRVTVEMLGQIRYLNQVAVSMRRGLLEPAAAVHEMELTERKLQELVRSLREHAGRE